MSKFGYHPTGSGVPPESVRELTSFDRVAVSREMLQAKIAAAAGAAGAAGIVLSARQEKVNLPRGCAAAQ